MYPEGREGIGPIMSSTGPVDLVQDAASDCSVVASLCAGVARAERGHDQVSLSSESELEADSHRCYQTNCFHITSN